MKQNHEFGDKKIAIIGLTGHIGRGLPKLLKEEDFTCTGITRSSEYSKLKEQFPLIDNWQSFRQMDLSHHHAVINLAGERVDQRWTESKKRDFYESRVGLTNQLVDHLATLSPSARPKILVNASAVGIYGDRGDEVLDESSPLADGFLAELCKKWEEAADRAAELGVRVVKVRIGIVLGKNLPAYENMKLIFKLGIGGRLGSGKQWMPWIHVKDLQRIITFAIVCDEVEGVLNGVAPTPLRNEDFTRRFSKFLRRPAFFPAPKWALQLVLGEFAAVLLASSRAMPHKIESFGFSFDYPNVIDAFENANAS